MKILVTGGNGQLGRAFSAIKSKFYDIRCFDKDQMDFTRPYEVWLRIKEFKPDVVIHAGAYTNVDSAEYEQDKVYKTNIIGTQNIASECLKNNIKMVYMSTDYVFNGMKGSYTEFDEPNPLNIYGKSKLEGEKIATKICSKLFIVRTSWLFGDGNNFVKTILKLAKERKYIDVVNDQYGCPTYAIDLANAILKLIETDAYGIYHMSNNSYCNRYEFAKEIIENASIDIKIKPIPTNKSTEIADRPSFSILRNYMLELTIGDNFRHWKDALKDYMKEIKFD